MKKLVLVFAILLSVSIASAKGPKFLGSWMSEKIVAEGADQQMFMPITFEDDNDMIADDMVFGIWHYDKKTKLINITSFLISEFNGDWEIIELSKEKLILKMGDYEWHLFKYDKEAIAATNAKFGLSGLWKMESRTALVSEETVEEAVEEATEEAVEEEGSQEEYYEEYVEELPDLYFNFENVDYSLKAISSGYTSSSQGNWVYKPKQNSIMFIGGRQADIIGNAKILEHNENTLSFENNGFNYVFKRMETVEVEYLDFDYHSLRENKNEDIYPPWGKFDKLTAQMTSIKMMVYSKGVFNTELKIFDFSTVIYKTQVEEGYNVSISEYSVNGSDTTQENEVSIGEDYGSENEFFPLEKFKNYSVVGKETITVPAGTFECTVVMGLDDDDVKYKVWMIDAKTGVYAKIISQKEDYRDRILYTETVLKELK